MRIILTTGLGRSEKGQAPKDLGENIGLPYEIFEYQHLIEQDTDTLFRKHSSYGGPLMRKGKKLLYDYAADATMYDMNKEAILNALDELVGEDDNIVFIGHSLGCLIMYDYLKEWPAFNNATFITTGCPIPLFRKENYSGFVNVDWTNYWEDSDPISHKLFRPDILDREHKSRHFFKGWNWLAHLSYFKSKKLAKKIRKDILG